MYQIGFTTALIKECQYLALTPIFHFFPFFYFLPSTFLTGSFSHLLRDNFSMWVGFPH